MHWNFPDTIHATFLHPFFFNKITSRKLSAQWYVSVDIDRATGRGSLRVTSKESSLVCLGQSNAAVTLSRSYSGFNPLHPSAQCTIVRNRKRYDNTTSNASFSNTPFIEIKEPFSKALRLFPWQITEIRRSHLCRRGERDVRSKLHRSNHRRRAGLQRKPRATSRYLSRNVRRRPRRKNVDETILDVSKAASRNATPRRKAVQKSKASNPVGRKEAPRQCDVRES